MHNSVYISTMSLPFADKFGQKHSPSIQLQDNDQCAVIPSNCENKIALMSQSWPTSLINCKLEVVFSLQSSEPVLGFSYTDTINCNDVHFLNDPQLSLVWLISQRLVFIDGKQYFMQMPTCSSSAIIEIRMMNGNIEISVLNPGKARESAKLPMEHLADRLFLFVGALKTGNKFVSFQLRESDIEQKEFSLTDVTKEIRVEKVFGNMHISQVDRKFTRTSTEQGNSCALLSMKIQSGRHRWSLKVSCDFGASLCVGLARHPFKLSDDYIRDPLKHIYRHPGLLLYRSYRGLLYMDGRQLERTLQPLGWQHTASVTITMDVNMENRTVEVLRNGKSLGIAFTEIQGPLQPVICFYVSYEKEIELVSYETSEISTTLLQQHSPRVVEEMTQQSSSLMLQKNVNFDPRTRYGSAVLSSDLKSVSRDKTQSGNSYCLMNIRCTTIGVYRFSFVIETDQGASVCIGVTDVNPEAIKKVEIGNIYLSPSFYLYRSFQGMLYVKGRELTKRFDEFWMSGTLIEMTIDISSNESVVQYTVNGRDQGIAFAGLKPPLTPVIAIYAGMEKRVTLIHFEHILKAVMPTQSTSSQNNINTTETHASRMSLPILASPRDAEQPSSRECMVCGRPADTILLPCLHSIFCAVHAFKSTACILCGQNVDSVWNVLLDR